MQYLMVKICNYILLSLSLFLGLNRQLKAQPSIHLIDSFRVDALQVFADNLNHIYLLSRDGILSKRNDKFQIKYTYSRVEFGLPDDVDLTNPLHALVYYESYQQIIILDNQLSTIGSVDLARAGLFDVRAICYADDNSVWVFDHALRKLIKINNSGLKEQESIDLGLRGNEVNITKIIQRNEMVYALDTGRGIYTFDRYAGFHKLLRIAHINNFWIDRNTLLLFQNNQLHRIHLISGAEDVIELGDLNSKNGHLLIENGKLWMLNKGYLFQYLLKW